MSSDIDYNFPDFVKKATIIQIQNKIEEYKNVIFTQETEFNRLIQASNNEDLIKTQRFIEENKDTMIKLTKDLKIKIDKVNGMDRKAYQKPDQPYYPNNGVL